MPTISAQTAARQLYKNAKAEAKRSVGGDTAYRFLGPDLRRAVVADRVLNVLYCQDDTIGDGTVRRLVDLLVAELSNDPDFH